MTGGIAEPGTCGAYLVVMFMAGRFRLNGARPGSLTTVLAAGIGGAISARRPT